MGIWAAVSSYRRVTGCFTTCLTIEKPRQSRGLTEVLKWLLSGKALMASSFVLRSTPFPPLEQPMRVLVTGAAGHIGSYFARQSHQRYQLKLMVLGNEKPESIDQLKS